MSGEEDCPKLPVALNFYFRIPEAIRMKSSDFTLRALEALARGIEGNR
jgi:hypothetical protein